MLRLLSTCTLLSFAITAQTANKYLDLNTKKLCVPKMQPIIIVHGGAGDIPNSRVPDKIAGVKESAKIGYRVLAEGGSALDAVEAAVVYMEKEPAFNAGYGSVLNLQGKVEMEASVMTGDLNSGAVTLVSEFEHPISIARKVLEESPHSLVGGEGAKMFALSKGFKTVDPNSLITEAARQSLKKFLDQISFGETEIGIDNESKPDVGTVGAVAIDSCGKIAVATSTGGMSGKIVGRIGDTPQIGSGTYADELVGGVSTTGYGEVILRYCLAHRIITNMELGMNAQEATITAVNAMTTRLKQTAGAITLSMNGSVGIHFSSHKMAWAYITGNELHYGIEKGEDKTEMYKQ